jgi:ergothioneine biosynthesis protein EgtB
MVTFTLDRPAAGAGNTLADAYRRVRAFSERLCEPLHTEDYVVQSMPDCSPTKWHLAHVSWFFETFLLQPSLPGYRSLHPQYTYLFNSYYNAVGQRHCRPKRGLISRPTVEETYRYRAYVDEHVLELLDRADASLLAKIEPVLVLGLHHEQQHQELLLTDLKHMLAENPLHPVYRPRVDESARPAASLEWHDYPGGLAWIGLGSSSAQSPRGRSFSETDAFGRFSFDNEGPRHQTLLQPYQLASRLVTNAEYLAFMADGGYQRPELWLSAGWATVQEQAWQAPLYWDQLDDGWASFTLHGFEPIDAAQPVCHLSYYEADAYARWADARLPTEFEWEAAAADQAMHGNFVESELYHPAAGGTSLYGDVWQWTSSSYAPYPGYRPAPGAIGEYNGKFMVNQYVLRGGSCATSASHIRPTYRNFFPADARWQFMGLRLARDAQA